MVFVPVQCSGDGPWRRLELELLLDVFTSAESLVPPLLHKIYHLLGLLFCEHELATIWAIPAP
jgi:hypothetical protein